MQAVSCDTATDAAAAAGVAVAGGIILATGALFWIDPAVVIVIAIVVGYHAVRLLIVLAAVRRAPCPESLGTTSVGCPSRKGSACSLGFR